MGRVEGLIRKLAEERDTLSKRVAELEVQNKSIKKEMENILDDLHDAEDRADEAEYRCAAEWEKERVVLICDRSRLEAELAAAREDSARLDALERLRLGLIPGMPKSKHDYWFVRTYNDKFGQPTGKTLRETIDAAIKVVMNA